MEITLRTATGEFVHKGIIPPFFPPPVIVHWGIRTFLRDLAVLTAYEYKESFAYTLTDQLSRSVLVEAET